MSVKAVIFDMDGVIIDSEAFWQRAQIDVLAKQGIAITAEECESATKGKRIDDIARIWCERYPLSLSSRQVEGQIVARVCSAICHEGVAMSGLDQALRSFHAAGYRLALATSSCKQVIEVVFDRLNLWDWFDVVCSADEEPYGKPHPAVYHTVMAKLGLEAAECRVIEDSLSGFTAARRAKIETFVVAADYQDVKFTGALGRYPTLDELLDALQPVLA
ncbi:HAD-IA family hydrolase [Escherichia coli]|jgi:HAD superfamily hydrolase (TIGR01509 family)|nr:HAD-IA family hydrolase [Escherichia coli]NUC52326.1 HAD-IA family hydrolase [Escherichia coli]HBB3870770.1 HAD-IA family hydrolase [Escherichia coli]HBB3977993.1 HAD-IA family hydrolase [Escherichia coli]